MYSITETSKAFIVATLIKQSTKNFEAHAAINSFLALLGANSIVLTQAVDPLDDIVIGVDPNPLDDIIIGIDPNPPVTFDAAIEELDGIAAGECPDDIKLAAEELSAAIKRVLEATSPLF